MADDQQSDFQKQMEALKKMTSGSGSPIEGANEEPAGERWMPGQKNSAVFEKNGKTLDPDEAKKRMDEVIKNVLKKYEEMDYKTFHDVNGITSYQQLKQVVLDEIVADFGSQKIDPDLDFESSRIMGFMFSSRKGKQDVGTVSDWPRTTFQTKLKSFEGENKSKIDVIRMYVSGDAFIKIGYGLTYGNYKNLRDFQKKFEEFFTAVASKQEDVDDGSYEVFIHQHRFEVKFKDGKYVGVSGDFRGLADSMTSEMKMEKLP